MLIAEVISGYSSTSCSVHTVKTLNSSYKYKENLKVAPYEIRTVQGTYWPIKLG